MASTTGSARIPMQGSCLPLICSSFIPSSSAHVSCPIAIEAVGFMATLQIIGIPFVIPPLTRPTGCSRLSVTGPAPVTPGFEHPSRKETQRRPGLPPEDGLGRARPWGLSELPHIHQHGADVVVGRGFQEDRLHPALHALQAG